MGVRKKSIDKTYAPAIFAGKMASAIKNSGRRSSKRRSVPAVFKNPIADDLPVRDQGELGTSVGHATAYAMGGGEGADSTGEISRSHPPRVETIILPKPEPTQEPQTRMWHGAFRVLSSSTSTALMRDFIEMQEFENEHHSAHRTPPMTISGDFWDSIRIPYPPQSDPEPVHEPEVLDRWARIRSHEK